MTVTSLELSSYVAPHHAATTAVAWMARSDSYREWLIDALYLPCSSNSALLMAVITIALIGGSIFVIRLSTRRDLEKCGLPTVYWTPRFITYQSQYQHGGDTKLPSSSITNILPRMKRLGGPYGMYGTVYGISTKVVHVGHPIPAGAILSPARRPSLRGKDGRLSARSACSASLKAPAYDHFKDFCGEGVFTADGEDWRAKRAAVMHALFRIQGKDGGFERKLEQLVEESARRLIKAFDNERGSSDSVDLNVVPILQRSTVGLIFRYITDTDLDVVLSDYTKANQRGASSTGVQKSKRESLMSSYRDSITRIRMIILAQSRSIWFLLPRFCYRFFSSMYREEQTVMGPIREFSRLACINAKEGSSIATLRETPKYRIDDGNNQRNGNPKISKNLLDEAITLLFAGQDTSAATLSWTLHLLSLYPKVQEKLFHEICQSLSETAGHEMLSKKVLSRLCYLDAVIKEAMRLYPVAPFVVRKLSERLDIGDPFMMESDLAKVSLPKGSFVCIWIYALHRNPEYWRQPDDFLPERWLSESSRERDRGIEEGAYMPFALGPRSCLGQPFAHIVLRTLLARMVQNFSFSDSRLEANEIMDPLSLRKDMQAGFTVLPQDGAHMTVTKR